MDYRRRDFDKNWSDEVRAWQVAIFVTLGSPVWRIRRLSWTYSSWRTDLRSGQSRMSGDCIDPI